MDFSIIQKADLSVAELAMLIRYKDDAGNIRSVTRAAAYRWIGGKAEPVEKLRMRVTKVLEILQNAVDAGDLPLKLGTPRTERKRMIAVAVGKHIQVVQS